jgi:hypothetical protein
LGGLHVLVHSQRYDRLGCHARASFPDSGRGDCTLSGLVSNELWCHVCNSSSTEYNHAEDIRPIVVISVICLHRTRASCDL